MREEQQDGLGLGLDGHGCSRDKPQLDRAGGACQDARQGWRKGDTTGKPLILDSFYTKPKFLAVYYFTDTFALSLLLEVADRPLPDLLYGFQ